MADMDTYDGEQRTYEDDRDYGRDRSRSPVDRDGDTRIREEPINGRADRDPPQKSGSNEDASNTGSNLFVTGIHPKLLEEEVTRLFEKYGAVEKCNIMRDPHTRESRGFGFVKMTTSEEADAAKEHLQGEVFEGRTLSIEKARRARPRTPTPGKYFGPPKREDRPPPRGGFRDRYNDDRSYGRRYDDRGPRTGGYRDRYDDRYEDRSYGRRRDDYGGSERQSGRDDRYAGGDRRGGGGYGYDRASRGPPADATSGSYGGGGSGRDAAPPARDYDDRRRYD